MLAGAGTLANSIRSLAVGGHISLIGSSLSRSGTMLDPLLLGERGMTLGSISVGSRTGTPTAAIGQARRPTIADDG
jgi:hypothetical protein